MISEAQAKEYYKALVEKNPEYDGTFYVGVKTTGIFCRPTCTANKPKFENCEFFFTAKEALYAAYRCCKRCKPLSHTDLISASIGELVAGVEEEPHKYWKTQDFRVAYPDALTVASHFKSHFNMTFIEYARARRMGLAMKHIRKGAIKCGDLADAFSEIMGTPPTNVGCHLKVICLATALGSMIAIADDKGLYLLEFVDRRALETEIKKLRIKLKAAIFPGRNPILDQIETELTEYFDARRSVFNTPLHLIGTDFQKSVWDQLKKIPIGETRNYSEIASALNNPSASRAVGNANGNNQLAIVIPCHRVINADGSLGGYGGGLDRKQKLLDLEKFITKSLTKTLN